MSLVGRRLPDEELKSEWLLLHEKRTVVLANPKGRYRPGTDIRGRSLILNMKYETLHWCLFNIGARLFGIMASLAGLMFGLTAILQASGANLPTPGVSALGNFFVSLICLALAVAILTRRPYRPDLPQEKLDKSEKPPKVGWWTGNHKRRSV